MLEGPLVAVEVRLEYGLSIYVDNSENLALAPASRRVRKAEMEVLLHRRPRPDAQAALGRDIIFTIPTFLGWGGDMQDSFRDDIHEYGRRHRLTVTVRCDGEPGVSVPSAASPVVLAELHDVIRWYVEQHCQVQQHRRRPRAHRHRQSVRGPLAQAQEHASAQREQSSQPGVTQLISDPDDHPVPGEHLDMTSLMQVLSDVQADPRHSHPLWRSVLRAIVIVQRRWRGNGIVEAKRAAAGFALSDAQWRMLAGDLLAFIRAVDPRHVDFFLPCFEVQLIAAGVTTIAALAALPLDSVQGTPGTRRFVRKAVCAAQAVLPAATECTGSPTEVVDIPAADADSDALDSLPDLDSRAPSANDEPDDLDGVQRIPEAAGDISSEDFDRVAVDAPAELGSDDEL